MSHQTVSTDHSDSVEEWDRLSHVSYNVIEEKDTTSDDSDVVSGEKLDENQTQKENNDLEKDEEEDGQMSIVTDDTSVNGEWDQLYPLESASSHCKGNDSSETNAVSQSESQSENARLKAEIESLRRDIAHLSTKPTFHPWMLAEADKTDVYIKDMKVKKDKVYETILDLERAREVAGSRAERSRLAKSIDILEGICETMAIDIKNTVKRNTKAIDDCLANHCAASAIYPPISPVNKEFCDRFIGSFKADFPSDLLKHWFSSVPIIISIKQADNGFFYEETLTYVDGSVKMFQ